jgi:hypothetical protein
VEGGISDEIKVKVNDTFTEIQLAGFIPQHVPRSIRNPKDLPHKRPYRFNYNGIIQNPQHNPPVIGLMR